VPQLLYEAPLIAPFQGNLMISPYQVTHRGNPSLRAAQLVIQQDRLHGIAVA